MRLLALALLLLTTGPVLRAADRPNVLFIAIDDQNDWIGCLGGNPQVKTPNIDALAKRGTLFTNAHCQAPLCNPSRSSLLTGLRPSSTGIYGLAPGIREVEQTKAHVTLPQTFTQAGYHTFTCGKIYHDGSMRPTDKTREFNTWAITPGKGRPKETIAKLPEPRHPAMDWGPFPEKDADHGDYQIAMAAVGALEQAPKDQPFFIAAGFRLPHVPCFAPQAWFDLYPDATLQMPPVKEDDRDDLPKFADFLHWKLPEPRLSTLRKYNEWRPLVRAYLATISFMDAQVGKVIEALDKTGRADNTIIVLWSDHGWHLGEKLISGKNTLWNESTRVPLIFAGPGITQKAVCNRPAELLDIFPTLLDLAHMPTRADLEGHSLLPQLKDVNAARPWPAITTHNQGNHTIRTEDWRYIRYADGSEELYDEKADFNEWTNLAKDPAHDAIKKDLAKWLPKVDKPPVPGSKSRILTFDRATGEAIWEDAPIDKTAKLPEP
ncbi:MAG: sulfatase [Prosthecobacter sp.]|nr:sulfatase [Prosthecobacter sp.]